MHLSKGVEEKSLSRRAQFESPGTGMVDAPKLSLQDFKVAVLSCRCKVGSSDRRYARGLLASAILDRILHHSLTVNIKSESYRLQSRRKVGLTYPPPARTSDKDK